MTVTIDLCADDDDDDERVGPAAASAIVNRQSVAKRKEHPTTDASCFADDDDNEDNGADSEVEATFSEGEQDEDEGRKIADTADADGYDFSGTCVADAAQSECPLCDAPFQVTWDAEFQSLVYPGTIMLRHQIFHADCVARRRGAPDETLGSRRPTPPPADGRWVA